ncbi:MAG: hypothetical protein EOO40_00665 [Deltaproteobacteria bacterium]|nr:MAG: hypothetical protein EOO40_00665 [Deltaproteobacteria bacterium]
MRAGVTDVADSSGIRYLCAAIARQLDEFYHQVDKQRRSWDLDTAQGADADLRAVGLTAGNITRSPPVATAGQRRHAVLAHVGHLAA